MKYPAKAKSGKFVARAAGVFWGKHIQVGELFERFDPAVKGAVLAHEEGHLILNHARRRVRWACSFRLIRALVTGDYDTIIKLVHEQEFEADAYAARTGHAEGMLRFLAMVQAHEEKHPEAARADLLHPKAIERILRLLSLDREKLWTSRPASGPAAIKS